MRRLTAMLLIATALLTPATAAEGWFSNYGKALEQAKATGKPILADFSGTDWCPPCQSLDKNILSTDAFKAWAKKNVVLFKAEYLRYSKLPKELEAQNERLALKYGINSFPTVLMLDEPMGSLDRTLRDRLLEELQHILREVGVTVLYVTHDQAEAFAIADRVILMHQGQVIQAAPPGVVYRHPVNAWAARFLGMRNLLSGKRVTPGVAQTDIGQLLVEGDHSDELTILIRPEAATLGHVEEGTPIFGTLTSSSFRGALVHIAVQCRSGPRLYFDLPSGISIPAEGEPITLTLRRAATVCLGGEEAAIH